MDLNVLRYQSHLLRSPQRAELVKAEAVEAILYRCGTWTLRQEY